MFSPEFHKQKQKPQNSQNSGNPQSFLERYYRI